MAIMKKFYFLLINSLFLTSAILRVKQITPKDFPSGLIPQMGCMERLLGIPLVIRMQSGMLLIAIQMQLGNRSHYPLEW